MALNSAPGNALYGLMKQVRWQLLSDSDEMAIGRGLASLIPVGAVVSAVARDGEIVEAPTWNGIELPLPLPLNAAPLDDEARGIDLDAIKARAAAGK